MKEKLKTLCSLGRSPKISSVLYKDPQYVLENMQVMEKFLSECFLQEIILGKITTAFLIKYFMHICTDVLSVSF